MRLKVSSSQSKGTVQASRGWSPRYARRLRRELVSDTGFEIDGEFIGEVRAKAM